MDFNSVLGQPDKLKTQVRKAKNIMLPTKVKQLSKGFKSVHAWGFFSVALKNDGTVMSWGTNNRG